MPARYALVIAVDGLRASALGAYGNAWYETPSLDALASQSHVVDWLWCDCPTTTGFYRAVWQGQGGDAATPSAVASLAKLLADAGLTTVLTTDEPQLADAADFAEICRVEGQDDQTAATIDETSLAQLFAVAAEQLESAKPGLMWIHARGFHGPWDAPLELRQSLLDDEDPAPPEFVAPPELVTAADQDDALLYRVAYAAQAIALDECVGGLLAALAESPIDRETLVVLVGTRGYALGEHGTIGGQSRSLYSDQLQVPCLLRPPHTQAPPVRLSALAQPVDLFATLLAWFGAALPDELRRGRDLLADEDESPAGPQWIAANGEDGELAIRTAAWMLRRPPTAADGISPPIELYAKPDDRWEANEIADRCPEVAERLLAAIQPSPDGSLAPLDADLASAFR